MLKDLITSEINQIERKYHEPIQVANHIRLLITSNEDWVVPAGRDDRRFAVLDVGDARKEDTRYFGAMMRQLEEEDGYAALLDFLLSEEIDEEVIRRPPRTAARTEQKHHSLTVQEEVWLDILMEGVLPYDADGKGVCEAMGLSSYFAEKTRWSRGRQSQRTGFGKFLKRMAPGRKRTRHKDPVSGGRIYVYEFPTLAECRRDFDADAEWPEPHEWQPYVDLS